MNSEAANSRDLGLESGRIPGLIIFRNNSGVLMDATGRPVYYGVGGPTPGKKSHGGSDWIGWQTVTITPEMVGQKVAIFCGFEVKDDEANPKTDTVLRQENFIHIVNTAGGRAGFVKRPIDAHLILERKGCVRLSEYPRERLT